MLTKLYKCHDYIYKDIKHLVRKNLKLHYNDVFFIESSINMLVKQLKLLNKCTNYFAINLTKFYKCHLYIYKDIKHLVRKN
jgi:hypothetical protein